MAILSNSAGSCDDADFSDALRFEQSLGIPVIRHQIKKPACIDEVQHYCNKLFVNSLVTLVLFSPGFVTFQESAGY
mgnify:CR=1 FL=1